MSNIHKSKQYDLIDIFNDTSRYLDDIYTIDNPEFEKHIQGVQKVRYPFQFAMVSRFINTNLKFTYQ